MAKPQDSKERTHQRIRAAAAASVRQKGILGTSVHDVMRQANLTVGGFYAHYESKDALISDAFDAALAQRVAVVTKALSNSQPADYPQDFIDIYLTPDHVASPETGCLWAALLSEMPRLDGTMKTFLVDRFQSTVDYLAGAKSVDDPGSKTIQQPSESPTAFSRQDLATATLALGFACLNLARLATDETARDQILSAGKTAVAILQNHVQHKEQL